MAIWKAPIGEALPACKGQPETHAGAQHLDTMLIFTAAQAQTTIQWKLEMSTKVISMDFQSPEQKIHVSGPTVYQGTAAVLHEFRIKYANFMPNDATLHDNLNEKLKYNDNGDDRLYDNTLSNKL